MKNKTQKTTQYKVKVEMSPFGSGNYSEFVIDAESKEEAKVYAIDEIWYKTDESVWVNDGYEPGETGFNRWIEDLFNFEIEDLDEVNRIKKENTKIFEKERKEQIREVMRYLGVKSAQKRKPSSEDMRKLAFKRWKKEKES